MEHQENKPRALGNLGNPSPSYLLDDGRDDLGFDQDLVGLGVAHQHPEEGQTLQGGGGGIQGRGDGVGLGVVYQHTSERPTQRLLIQRCVGRDQGGLTN